MEIKKNVLSIYSKNKKYLTKNECRNVLNNIFELLFNGKLQNNNFEYIYKILKGKDKYLTNIEPIIIALTIGFDVNYLKNSSLTERISIKIGKYLLPTSFCISKT